MPYDTSLAYEVEKEIPEPGETLKPGIYNFETVWCKEGFTKDNRPKVHLKINVFDNEGKKFPHFMHLVTSNKYCIFHLKRYWDSVGHPEMFEAMSLVHDENAFEGKCGRVKTKLEKDTYNGVTEEKSVVDYFLKSDYVIKEEEKIDFLKDDVDEIKEDEIPF